MRMCVCVCERERERERNEMGKDTNLENKTIFSLKGDKQKIINWTCGKWKKWNCSNRKKTSTIILMININVDLRRLVVTRSLSKILQNVIFICISFVSNIMFVAVTDLFPLANQCPTKRFDHSLTNQGQSALIPFSSQELFFVAFFGSRPTVREHQVSSQDRPLSRHLLRTFHMEELH